MALLDGCQEGKHTPKLVEVFCPQCGKEVEVFVKLGGGLTETGRTVSDETCLCGYVIPAGTVLSQLKAVPY